MHFSHAPLAELIAELRWTSLLPAGFTSVASGPISIQLSGSQSDSLPLEKFYEAMRDALAGVEYVQSERLVGPGMITPPGVPAYRFRKNNDPSHLVQLGVGVMSVHALPPYQSWDAFSPKVAEAVGVLLSVRPEPDSTVPFSGVTLRYINVFDQSFLQGSTPGVFAQERLGFQVTLPGGIHELVNGPIDPFSLQLGYATPGEERVQLVVAEGQSAQGPLLVVDNAVSKTTEVPVDADLVAKAFYEAHEVTRSSFLGMTAGIGHLLGDVAE